ncbi:MAG: hypothetical protein P9L91_00800, partial [Candidatus Zophobacter franzmannii]|nr:hypothetical protein [Candidatus Zophobacter franzmannii]
MIIQARSFLAKDLQLAGLERSSFGSSEEFAQTGLEDRLSKDSETQASLIPEFSFGDSQKGTVSVFDSHLQQAAKLFEENELAKAKLDLISNANDIATNLLEETQSEIHKWIDTSSAGPIQAIALTEDMLGISPAKGTEERRPIPFYEDEIKKRLEASAGVLPAGEEATDLAESILVAESLARSIQADLENATARDERPTTNDEPSSIADTTDSDEDPANKSLDRELALEVPLSASEDQDGEREHLISDLIRRKEEAETRAQDLRTRQSELEASATIRQRLWEGSTERGNAFRSLDESEKESIALKMKGLCTVEKATAEVDRKIEGIKDRVNREIGRIALLFPGILALAF